MLVATLDVRNASIKRPVGTSKVRMTESIPVAINHLESGENVYCSVRNFGLVEKTSANHVEDLPRETTQFSDHLSGFDVNNSNNGIFAYHTEETTVLV